MIHDWRTAPWVILDCETTGVDCATARIVEVAAVVVHNGVVLNRFGWLVNPSAPIPPECTAIHGITDEMVRNAPTFSTVAFDLAAATEGALPVAYNARFDRAQILAEYLRTGFASPPPFVCGGGDAPWIDPLTWARARDPFVKTGADKRGRHTLGVVAERLGVEVGAAHRAVGDCETTARVLTALANERMHPKCGVERMPDDFADLIFQQRRLAALNDANFVEWLMKQPKQQEHAAA